MAQQCAGSIDYVNNISPAPELIKASSLLDVRGWLASSIDPAEVPESVYLILSDHNGRFYFIGTRHVDRPDVGAYFNNRSLNSLGYKSVIDVTHLKGDYIFGLAYAKNKELFLCPQFKITVKINQEQDLSKKIILPGGAGLVGQNLVVRLKEKGYRDMVVLDKHRTNLEVLRRMHPDITAEYADLAEPGDWREHFVGADAVVMLQAQIGGNDYQEFVRNNINSTRLILETMKENDVPHLVHISSSVVESVADDFYTNTKKEQEKMVMESGISCHVLRPTLMFGWFDRKHLGWLSRFMKKVPVFPVPGNGRYVRQPLYVGDFVKIIISCIEHRAPYGVYNISGHEKIDYIDIIREIRRVTKANTVILRIPYFAFYAMLWTWGLFDKNPPFTTQQLKALVAKDEFEVIDWPDIFGVPYTPFKDAVYETFNDPHYSNVVLEF